MHSRQDSANLTPSRRAPVPPSHQQRQPSYGASGSTFSNGSPGYPINGANNGHQPTRSQLFSSTSYAPSFQYGSSQSNSPSGQMKTPGYGASPTIVHNPMGTGMLPAGMNRLSSPTSSSTPIRQGMVGVKEEEGIRSFLWSKKWLVLRDQTLSFHKNEVRNAERRLHLDTCLPLSSKTDIPDTIFYDPAKRYFGYTKSRPQAILFGG